MDFMIKSIILSAFIIAALLLLFSKAVSKQERLECQQWQAQAEQFPSYYLTRWQAEQCQHYGVEIDSPVLSDNKVR